MRSSGRSTLPTCRRSSTRAATAGSQRHVTRPPTSARSTGRARRSRRTMPKVLKPHQHTISSCLCSLLTYSPPHLLRVPSREASLPRDLSRQLGYRLPGAAPGGQRVYQRAVPARDAHLHIPAARPQRVQRGFPELHREGPDRAVHHDGSGTGWCVKHNTPMLLIRKQLFSFSF